MVGKTPFTLGVGFQGNLGVMFGFRFAEGQIGGLGAEEKTQSLERSSEDCESFLRAPIVNQSSAQRASHASEAGYKLRDSIQFECVRFNGLLFTFT